MIFILLLFPLLAVNCSQPLENQNSNTANSNLANSNASQSSGMPRDAKPMGQVAPGYFMAGPNGDVSLQLTEPADGGTVPENFIRPRYSITGYPVYKDDERNKGQHVHMILDNEPYEAAYHPDQPFRPENGLFDNLKDGTHTLRAFPSREWHESIKDEDGSAFSFITFQVKKATPGLTIDKTKPLLTYSRPKGEYRWKDDPRGVMLDFYVANARIGPNDYRVKYSVNNGRVNILTRWEPVWIKWEELPPQEYTVDLQLIDADNKPVPFKVGNVDYNHTVRKFTVLPQGAPASGK
jgi:hypothetical protein